MGTTSFDDEHKDESRVVWVNGAVIVGAGPSGLAVAAGLQEQGVPFVIIERADCIASLWQKRAYDRLRLHLPKQFCQLPGLPFPPHYPSYPSKDQFLDFLHSYAHHFRLRPRFNETVASARHDAVSGLWLVRTVAVGGGGGAEYLCRSLVVATGENAEMVVPEVEGVQEFCGRVLHASEYKSGEDYRGKKVLVVGCGNSGMEVSLDLSNHNAFPSMVVRSSVMPTPLCLFFFFFFVYNGLLIIKYGISFSIILLVVKLARAWLLRSIFIMN